MDFDLIYSGAMACASTDGKLYNVTCKLKIRVERLHTHVISVQHAHCEQIRCMQNVQGHDKCYSTVQDTWVVSPPGSSTLVINDLDWAAQLYACVLACTFRL